MTCEDYRDLMMGYLDNELDDQQKTTFRNHLSGCPSCREELAEFQKLKSITDNVTLLEPEDRIWQQYWSGIYNRLERGIGWILFGVSAILLLIYAGFKMIEGLVTDPSLGLGLKLGLLALIAGLAILFVSAIRERLFFWSKDRYKDVRR
jgi:predicted anti-sigma-YlaC factor YlaD